MTDAERLVRIEKMVSGLVKLFAISFKLEDRRAYTYEYELGDQVKHILDELYRLEPPA